MLHGCLDFKSSGGWGGVTLHYITFLERGSGTRLLVLALSKTLSLGDPQDSRKWRS